MKVFVCVVVLGLVGACAAAAADKNETPMEKSLAELLPGVSLQEGQSGFDFLNVKFQPGELKDVARTFEEARGKIKKLAGPLLAGIGIKILGVVALLGGGLTLLVTKALVVAKLAFILAAILGLQKLMSSSTTTPAPAPTGFAAGLAGKFGLGGGNSAYSGGWASSPSAAYPYARAIEIHGEEAGDLAYKGQKPT